MNSIELGIIITTTSSFQEAGKIAESLIQNNLAINIDVSKTVSINKNAGKINQKLSYQLMIKTDLNLFHQIETKIIELNLKSFSEIIALPLSNSSHHYFNFLLKTTPEGLKHLVIAKDLPVIFETLPRRIKLEMLKIPAGEFIMGSNESDKEKPLHKIKLKEFYLAKYPITQIQYESIMGTNPATFIGQHNPVEGVSWFLAKEFCQKLSQITGKQYQLPSEAQWEYACKAGSETKWCFGDNKSQLKNYGWYADNSEGKTHPVGLKKPNQWGLHDMHGNVWEWCEDDASNDYQNTPTDGSAYQAPILKNKILRGGSWYVNTQGCRSAGRFNRNPKLDFNGSGFRVVLIPD